jgi:hypothetical protein
MLIKNQNMFIKNQNIIIPIVLANNFKLRNPYDRKTRASQATSNKENCFKNALLNLINPDSNHLVSATSNSSIQKNESISAKCMLTGQLATGDNIRAVHIIPAVTEIDILNDLNLKPEQINDVRNGLLLCRSIELGFDKLRLSFVKSPLSDQLILKIWDESIRKQRLFKDCLKIGEYKGVHPLFFKENDDKNENKQLTIGHFENHPLNLKLRDDYEHKPFRRGLFFQAFHAYQKWKIFCSDHVLVDDSSDIACNFFKQKEFYCMKQNVIESIEKNDDDGSFTNDSLTCSEDEKKNEKIYNNNEMMIENEEIEINKLNNYNSSNNKRSLEQNMKKKYSIKKIKKNKNISNDVNEKNIN